MPIVRPRVFLSFILSAGAPSQALALLHYGPARFLIRGFAMAPAVLIAPWLLLLLYVRVYRNTGLTDWVEVEVQSKDQYFWGCLQLLDALADRLH